MKYLKNNEISDVQIRQAIFKACGDQQIRFLGIVPVGPEPDFCHFQRWLVRGMHAEMSFLERNQNFRQDPRGLLPGARSAIVVAQPYGHDFSNPKWSNRRPLIAQYARFKDYHKTLRKACSQVSIKLSELGCRGEFRIVVDSAPVLERALATRVMQGFVGKNTCFIHPEEGSFFLLAAILTTLPLATDVAEPVNPQYRGSAGGCGSCRRCQVHCPTGALSEDYSLDARRCIAYWTIEHRGTIPKEFWPYLGLYFFGCDICQLVCPYNRKGFVSTTPPTLTGEVDLFEVATMDQKQYEQWFGGTPLTRAKRSGLRRNALIGLHVTGDPRLKQALRCIDERDEDMLIKTVKDIEEDLSRNGAGGGT